MSQKDGPEEVRASFSLSRAEYIRAVRYYLRKSHLVSWVQIVVILLALAASIVMSVLMERMSFLCTLLVVLAVMVAGYGIWLYFFQPGRLYDKNPELGRPVSFLFNREDMARQDEKTAVLLDWDLKKLWRGKEFYYLFRGDEGYLLLPKSAFRSEEECLHFEYLAQAACPKAKMKHFD